MSNQQRSIQQRLLIIIPLIIMAVAAVSLIVVLTTNDEPSPTLVPTTETLPTNTAEAAATQPAQGTDPVWSRIQAAGKIVVGTAADYPPFSYYDADFRLDGFDVALIRDIGARLGLEVEIKDFAFEGLGSALELGQIDVAIAALSVTPEREAIVDFSNIYFVSEDAILGRDPAGATINRVEDLAGYRVGVQSLSVHEEWLQTNLVETGRTDPSNLFVYQQIDRGVSDLGEGVIDFVALDLPPAQVAVQSGGFAIAGRGLNRQRFAIAVPQGAGSLRTALNDALTQMQNEGKLSELVQEYLGLDGGEVAPLPTPEPPPPTPTPEPGGEVCIDGMSHVQDLTFDDLNMTAPPELAPGQPFVKGWRVRNSGTCTWDPSYTLVYVGGNVPAARMGGEPVAITREVLPQDTFDMQVNLVAPLAPGVYQGFWQMRNGEGIPFGQRIWVGISVPGLPTPTPAPTQTPAPGISFSADRTRIRAGERVIFSWNVTNVKAVFFYAQGERWEQNGVPGQGSREVWPPRTTIYELRVVKPDDSVEIRQIRIEVEPVPNAPTINRFTVEPSPQSWLGQPITIRWEVSGDVSRIKILRNESDLSSDAPLAGRIVDASPPQGELRYAIEASGPGGTSRMQRVVIVTEPATPVPPPTPTVPAATPVPEPPVIHAFAVNPNVINAQECINLSWRVSGGATLIQIKRDGLVVLDQAPLNGEAQECLGEPGTVIYRLEATNSAGQTVFREEPVSVLASGTDNPLANTSWRAESYKDSAGDETPVLEGTTLTTTFDDEGGLNGSAGCNSYSSSYTVNDNTLRIFPINLTQQICAEPAGIMEQESAFLAALQSAVTFEITDNQLVIWDINRATAVTFVRQ